MTAFSRLLVRFAAVLCLACAAPSAVMAQGAATSSVSPFRYAVTADATGPCAPVDAAAPAGLRALATHLSGRLKRPFLACPTVASDAGARLAAGEVDLAVLDAATYAPHRALLRPVMTTRGMDNLGRLESISSALASSGRKGLAGLAGARIGYAGQAPYERAIPIATLLELGVEASVLEAGAPMDGPEGALAALREGRIDVMVLSSAAHQRICREQKAGEVRCGDLQILTRARPRAKTAWAMRRDTPDQDRFRLLGVLVALHLENRPAFDWMAPGAREIEPTEASAFDLPVFD